MKTRIVAVLAAVVVLIAVPACWLSRTRSLPPPSSVSMVTPPPVAVPQLGRYIGVVTSNLAAFDKACRCRPDMAVHYVPVGGDQRIKLARLILASGAVPLIELEPFAVPLAAIIAGREDRWLSAYARAVRALNGPVFMSFAPEANGDWYPWGYRHSSPLQFRRAWRHVVDVFRRADASNARWMWVVNHVYPHSTPLPLLWPGRSYVDMVGVDGYYEHRGQTFAEQFAETIAAVRAVTDAPVLIAETATAGAGAQARAIRELIASVKSYYLAGFIWFDIAQHGGASRQDWRLEGHPAAIAAFRKGVASMRGT
jgi:mannan endo-1,4-beta-mannosidase